MARRESIAVQGDPQRVTIQRDPGNTDWKRVCPGKATCGSVDGREEFIKLRRFQSKSTNDCGS